MIVPGDDIYDNIDHSDIEVEYNKSLKQDVIYLTYEKNNGSKRKQVSINTNGVPIDAPDTVGERIYYYYETKPDEENEGFQMDMQEFAREAAIKLFVQRGGVIPDWLMENEYITQELLSGPVPKLKLVRHRVRKVIQ